MLTTIYLHGELAHRFGRKWKLAVRSPSEALRAIDANSPGLMAYLIEAGDRGVAFKVKVNGQAVDEEHLGFQRQGTVIRISPVVQGRKSKVLGVILGVALVALTWGAGAGVLGAAAKGFSGTSLFGIQGMTAGMFVGSIGLSMAVSGVSAMLAKPASVGGQTEQNRPSYLFNGPVNTTAEGGPVPLALGGPLLVGSQVISAGIYSEDMNGEQEGDEGAFAEDPDYPDYSGPTPSTDLTRRSLQTRQRARILDLISEGEISLVDAAGNVLSEADRNKAILFDLTPAQAAGGAMNFKGFASAFRPGTASQSSIPGFPSAESETSVETEVIKGDDKEGNAVQREIPAGSHNAIRVTVRIPALYQYDEKGNRNGSAVHFSIQIKRTAESTWKEAVGSNPLPDGELDGLIQGEAVQPYVRSYRINLHGVGPWDVRILKETDDSEDEIKHQNKLFWQSYTTIIDKRFTYRHSAIVGTEFDAEKFPRVPGRAFRIMGMKIRVPSNYNPVTRNYTGVWDGTFSETRVHSTNPAWNLFEVMTNKRCGLGNYFPEAEQDKWAFYEIGRYCDAVDASGNYVGVDAGKGDGSKEPRFALSAYFQGEMDAFQLISDIVSSFRGMLFWGGGMITAVQDSPKDPQFNFTNANVIGGDFVYSGSDRKSRHTLAYVQWNDPDDFFKAKLHEVPDEEGIKRFGVLPTRINSFGATSLGQAHRTGLWQLLTEKYENEMVTFQTQLEGARVRPGSILNIRDRFETVNRMGGRVAAVGSGEVTLDAAVVIGSGTHYLSVAKQDGSLVELTVTSGAGTHTTLAVTGSLAGIVANAVWVLRTDALVPTQWRALNIKELGENKYEIQALRHIPGKYANIENGEELEIPQTNDLPDRGIPLAPTDLGVEETAVATADGRTRFLQVTWRASASRWVRGYRVEYRPPGGEWSDLDAGTASLRSSRVPVTVLGDHNFRVRTIGYYQNSDPVPITYTLEEVTAPAAVEGFTVTPIANGFEIKWSDALKDTGFYKIKIAATNVEPEGYSWTAPGGTTQKTLPNIGSGVARYLWIIPSLHRVDVDGPSVGSGPHTTLTSAEAIEALIESVDTVVDGLIAEAADLAADLLAEVAAREAAIIAEASTRSTADGVITTALDAVTADYNSNKATVASQISAITGVNSAQATDISALYAGVASNSATISSVDSARASGDSALSSSISSLSATVSGISASVSTIAAAYIVGGVPVATYGFKLDGGGKVVAMQAIAASGGTQPETGVIIFSGADLRSDNYSAGSAGWIIRADGSVEFADGTFRGDLRLNSSTSTPGYSGNTETGFAVEAANGAMFASRNDNFAGSFNRNDNGDLVLFHRGGNQVGTVAVTSVSTSYNTSSDERIKFNMVEAPDVGDLIDAAEVYEFEFFMQPGVKYLGFKAQQLNEVFGQAVTPGDNNRHPFLGGRPWAVDHSKLVPLLWRDAQKTHSRLSAIEQRLDILEAA